MSDSSPSATTTSALDALRDRLRAAGKEGKDLRESLTDLVMDEATRVMRELRQALATSQEQAASYMLAWELAEKHNALLQSEVKSYRVGLGEAERELLDAKGSLLDAKRMHADLLSPISIVTAYPNTLGDALAEQDFKQLWRIADRWTKEQG